MVKIVLSKTAKADIKGIYDYIKRDSAKYAFIEKEKIRSAIDKLRTQPLLGRVLKELPEGSYREMAFQNYRIIYKIVSDKELHVLSVHHHARSLGNNRAFNDDE